jgi:hypothetical protein
MKNFSHMVAIGYHIESIGALFQNPINKVLVVNIIHYVQPYMTVSSPPPIVYDLRELCQRR